MTAWLRVNRRDLLKLGLGVAAGLASTNAPAQFVPGPYGGPVDRARSRQRNPVLFWSDVSLKLVALDHSIDAMESRAPGPCASARALGLVHIVMADAVAAVYPVDFDALLIDREERTRDYPEAFVGGAAARILEHIFGASAHSELIGSERQRFLGAFEPAAQRSWEAGLAFARNNAFTSRWDGNAIRQAAMARRTAGAPGPRGHTVDPFNPDQGFYGVNWGGQPPLDPQFGSVTSYRPPPPPGENDAEYLHDFEEVRRLGVYREGRPTNAQVRVGLFWAYDGARLIGTPPRLYNQIVRQVAEDDDMSVPETARLLALCNLAMADAGIVAWEAKYHYDLWRPVVAIRQSPGHRSWRPLGSPRTNPRHFAPESDIQSRRTAQMFMGMSERDLTRPSRQTLDYARAAFTPNFPAYPSGHATFGSACFTILKRVRAERELTRVDPNRISPEINFVSDELNGVSIDNFRNRPRPYVPHSYTSIDRMIEDNNRSRVHLGVHWNFDCERGAEAGARVADRIYDDAYQREHRPEIGASQGWFGSRARR